MSRVVFKFLCSYVYIKVTTKILENTTDNFTQLASSVGVLEHEVQGLKLNDFARSNVHNSLSAEDSAEMNLRRLISMAHDIGGVSVASAADNEVAALQAELGTICKAELAMKELHQQRCHELQDSWDKLVSLRKHIAQFRAAIEETTIEDVHNQAYYYKPDGTRIGGRTRSDPMDSVGSSSMKEMSQGDLFPSRAGSQPTINQEVRVQVLRERIRVRDALRQRAADTERKMTTLRDDLRKSASVLAESSQVPLHR